MIGSQNAIVVDVVTGFCNRPAVGLSIPPHTRLCVTHHQSSGNCKSIMPIVPCVLYRSSSPRHRPDAMLAEGWRTNLCISFLQPVQFWTNLFDAMNVNVTAPSARRPNLNPDPTTISHYSLVWQWIVWSHSWTNLSRVKEAHRCYNR